MSILKDRKFATKKDIIIVLVILAVAVAGILIYNIANKPMAPPEENSSNVDTSSPSSDSSSSSSKPTEDPDPVITDSVVVEIFSGDTVLYTLGISDSQVIQIPDKEVKIELKDNTVGFIESDCPDQICVHTGFLDRPGYVAACLPNNVVVVLSNNPNLAQSSADVDTTA